MITTPPSEHSEQVAVIQWADLQPLGGGYNVGAFLFAVPNGGVRSKITAKLLQAEGVRAGVPDLMLAVPRGGKSGLFIEMKRAKKSLSKVSDAQKDWHKRLTFAGYAVAVCYGADEAIKTIKAYLNLK